MKISILLQQMGSYPMSFLSTSSLLLFEKSPVLWFKNRLVQMRVWGRINHSSCKTFSCVFCSLFYARHESKLSKLGPATASSWQGKDESKCSNRQDWPIFCLPASSCWPDIFLHYAWQTHQFWLINPPVFMEFDLSRDETTVQRWP